MLQNPERFLAASSNLASVELPNYSLGFIRSPRRNSMTENQLNALFLLFCHRDICHSINLDKVINNMSVVLFVSCFFNYHIYSFLLHDRHM